MNIKVNSKRIVIALIGTLALGGLIFAGIFTAGNTRAQKETKKAAEKAAQNLVCGNAALSGKYAVMGSGYVPDGPPAAPMVPFANMSLMTLDGAGGLTNKVTVSRNGQIQQNLDLGTYSVNPDCTGTMTITIPSAPFQLTFNLVVADLQGDKAKEFYFIATTNSVVTHKAKRIQ
jgi:hypothetical protein